MLHSRSTYRGFFRLGSGLFAITLFIFGVAPLVQKLPPVEAVHEVSRRQQIEASALFYTESSVAEEATYFLSQACQWRSATAGNPAPRDRSGNRQNRPTRP